MFCPKRLKNMFYFSAQAVLASDSYARFVCNGSLDQILLEHYFRHAPGVEAERQHIGPANSSGEQLGSKMLIFSTVENKRAKLKCVLQLNHPNSSAVCFVDHLVSETLSICGETSKPYSLCRSRLDITVGYRLWKTGSEVEGLNGIFFLYHLPLSPCISSLFEFLPSDCSHSLPPGLLFP